MKKLVSMLIVLSIILTAAPFYAEETGKMYVVKTKTVKYIDNSESGIGDREKSAVITPFNVDKEDKIEIHPLFIKEDIKIYISKNQSNEVDGIYLNNSNISDAAINLIYNLIAATKEELPKKLDMKKVYHFTGDRTGDGIESVHEHSNFLGYSKGTFRIKDDKVVEEENEVLAKAKIIRFNSTIKSNVQKEIDIIKKIIETPEYKNKLKSVNANDILDGISPAINYGTSVNSWYKSILKEALEHQAEVTEEKTWFINNFPYTRKPIAEVSAEGIYNEMPKYRGIAVEKNEGDAVPKFKDFYSVTWAFIDYLTEIEDFEKSMKDALLNYKYDPLTYKESVIAYENSLIKLKAETNKSLTVGRDFFTSDSYRYTAFFNVLYYAPFVYKGIGDAVSDGPNKMKEQEEKSKKFTDTLTSLFQFDTNNNSNYIPYSIEQIKNGEAFAAELEQVIRNLLSLKVSNTKSWLNESMYANYLFNLNKLRDIHPTAINKILAGRYGYEKITGTVRIIQDPTQAEFSIILDEAIEEIKTRELWKELESGNFLRRSIVDEQKLNEDIGRKCLIKLFDIETRQFSNDMALGIANSCLYLPFKTNVYDPFSYRTIYDEQYFKNVHYIWGYNRKALFIDERLNSATNNYITGGKGKLRPVILKDLMRPEKDIQLYTDLDYYNKEGLKATTDIGTKLYQLSGDAKQLTETIGESAKTIATVGGAIVKLDVGHLAGGLLNTAADAVGNTLKAIGDEVSKLWKKNSEIVFMTPEEIEDYMSREEYSPEKAFALASAIYRFKNIADFFKEEATPKPVFESSKDLYKYTKTVDPLRGQKAYLNYLLLANITDEVVVDFRSNLDMNSPVYLDIYGNIITESGIVVVPAVSNQTFRINSVSPVNLAFIHNYGKNVYAEEAAPMDEQFFELSEGKWKLKKQVLNETVNLEQLSFESNATREALLMINHYYILAGEYDNTAIMRNITAEVMRGAPIENIDKVAAGLQSAEEQEIGVGQAVKFEELRTNLMPKEGISFFQYPNISWQEDYEFWVFALLKLSIVVAMIVIIWNIYVAAVKQQISILVVFKLAMIMGVTVVMLFMLPKLVQASYYSVNKLFLQEEAEYISMLNAAKEANSYEIGITDIKAPQNKTDLKLLLDKVDTTFMDVVKGMWTVDITSTMRDAYKEKTENHPLFGKEGVELKEDKFLASYKEILRSSEIVFNANEKTLKQYTKGDPFISFYSPYYLLVDMILMRANDYASRNEIYSYVPYSMPNGKISTIGFIKPFFESNEFLDEKYDVLNLSLIYQTDYIDDEFLGNYEKVIERVRPSIEGSDWFPTHMSKEDREARVKKLNEDARKFVVNNRHILGTIPDEIFIQTMALHLATRSNKYNNMNKAASLDIYNINTEDMTRLATVTPDRLIKMATLSYERFIFEVAGTTGIYLATILEFVYLLGYIIKPVATFIILIVAFLSLIVHRMNINVRKNSFKDIVTFFFFLTSLNILYAISIKVLITLPRLGIGPGLSLFLQLLINLVFLVAFVSLIFKATKNWRDIGASELIQTLQTSVLSIIPERWTSLKTTNQYEEMGNGWEQYDAMKGRWKERNGVSRNEQTETENNNSSRHRKLFWYRK